VCAKAGDILVTRTVVLSPDQGGTIYSIFSFTRLLELTAHPMLLPRFNGVNKKSSLVSWESENNFDLRLCKHCVQNPHIFQERHFLPIIFSRKYDGKNQFSGSRELNFNRFS
jgi:hypothetical protein